MRALTNDQNLCNDKWLWSLVDAMDEVESLRLDDFCRSADVPAGLMAQLASSAGRSQPISSARFERA